MKKFLSVLPAVVPRPRQHLTHQHREQKKPQLQQRQLHQVIPSRLVFHRTHWQMSIFQQ